MKTTGAWAAGLGLGMMVAGAALIRASVGAPLTWAPLFWGAVCLGAVPFADYLLPRLWAVIVTVREARVQWQAEVAPPPTLSTTGPDPLNIEASRAWRWRVAADRFLQTGDFYGFAKRRLHDEMHVIGAEGWSEMVGVLCEAAILATGPRGTTWEVGRSLAWWRANWKTCPLPRAGEPPAVEFPVNTGQANSLKHAANTPETVG